MGDVVELGNIASVKVAEFDFDLPHQLIAQEPAARRDEARLLVLPRSTGSLVHTKVSALPDFLEAGDVLVVNNTRVFPARLLGRRVPTGGVVECLLVGRVQQIDEDGQPPGAEMWEALMHPGQKLKPGARVVFEAAGTVLHGEVVERQFYGRRLVRLWADQGSVEHAVDTIGHVPLPPYIKRPDRPVDRDRYQTVFAAERGSVAAPTAGLHFTPQLLARIRERDAEIAEITLHVGYGTFQPVRVADVEDHRVEPEHYAISEGAARTINSAVDEGRRVIAVGTTTTRTLESSAATGGRIVAGHGVADLFIYPGFDFRVVRGLVTNFHLPRSSLLMLVSAFAGRKRVLSAYHEAIARGYRFYSYGDATLIV
jgi:S-adenosylmethionine:tRNA ribosyltransferase-isomerase